MATGNSVEVVGFLGLGSMGFGMATNLLKHLKQSNTTLHVWNRTSSKADPLVETGAVRHETISELADKCTVIFSMLFNDEQITQVFTNEILPSAKPNTVFIDCSTVYPTTTTTLAQLAAQKNIHYVSCPVFGRPDAAMNKTLVMALACEEIVQSRILPYLNAMGRAVIHVGTDPTTAHAFKLVGNFFIANAIEVLAEGINLANKNNISSDTVMEFVKLMFPSVVYQGYGTRIARGDFEMSEEKVGFAVEGGLKDVGHIHRLAKESNAHVPIADIVLSHLKEAKEMGLAKKDWGAISEVVKKLT